MAVRVAMLGHISVVNVIVNLELPLDGSDSYVLGKCCGGQQESFIGYRRLEMLVLFDVYCHHYTRKVGNVFCQYG
jgi:hypothetical protein